MTRHELMRCSMFGQGLTLEALAEAAELQPALVEQLVSYGLLEPLRREATVIYFDAGAIARCRTIRRLRADLGINLPGIGAVLDLLQRIETLQRELAHYRNGQRREPSPILERDT